MSASLCGSSWRLALDAPDLDLTGIREERDSRGLLFLALTDATQDFCRTERYQLGVLKQNEQVSARLTHHALHAALVSAQGLGWPLEQVPAQALALVLALASALAFTLALRACL